jgi:hypothetical protein
MPVRIRCIRITPSRPVSNPPLLGRCISTSTMQRSPPPVISKTPSRFNLQNHLLPRQQGINPDGYEKFRIAYTNPSNTAATRMPQITWDINAEQNAVSKNIRINPAMINTNQEIDRTELWNAERWNNARKSYKCRLSLVLLTVVSNRDENIQAKYSFPLREGQLYTHKDLTFSAWEQRNKVQDAIIETSPDPFRILGIDPFWEYKVSSLTSYTHIFRITDSSRISYRQWDESSRRVKRAAPLEHNED